MVYPKGMKKYQVFDYTLEISKFLMSELGVQTILMFFYDFGRSCFLYREQYLLEMSDNHLSLKKPIIRPFIFICTYLKKKLGTLYFCEYDRFG